MAAIAHKAVFQTDVQTEISATFATKLTLNSADVSANAKYLVLCYAQLGAASAGMLAHAQLLHGTTVFTDSAVTMEPAGVATDTTPAMHSYGYMTVWDTSGGAESLHFQLAGDGSLAAFADTIVIFIMRIDADLVEGTDWVFNELTTDSAHNTIFATKAEVAPVVTSGESWLVIANVSYFVLSTNMNTEYRIFEDGGSDTTPGFSQEGERFLEFLSWLLSRVYTGLSTGVHTFSLQGRVDGTSRSGLTTQHLGSRIFAMRLDAFQHAVSQWNSGNIAVGTSEVTVATASVTPTTTADFLMLGYATYDAGAAGAKMRLFVDESGGAPTPTGADKQFVVGSYDATDENPATALAVPSLSNGVAKTFKLVAQGSVTDRVAKHRSLLLLSMELASAGGSPPLFPAPIPLALTPVAPTITFGALTVSPAPVALSLAVVEPTITKGPKTLSPSPVALALTVVAPTITFGALTVSPAPIALPLTVVAPFVDAPSAPIILTPAPIALALTVVAPTVTFAALTLSPAPIALALTVVEPGLLLEKTVSPAPIALALSVVAPSITLGALTLSPSPIALPLNVTVPGLLRGGVTTLLVGDLWRTDPAQDYPATATYELEVELSVSSVQDTASAALFNVTDGIIVPGTSVGSSSTTKELKRSATFTFPASGAVKEYRVLLFGTVGSARWHSAKMRIKSV